MDYAKNPWGAYDCRVNCMYCGANLFPLSDRTLLQKIASKLSLTIYNFQQQFVASQPLWIQASFRK